MRFQSLFHRFLLWSMISLGSPVCFSQSQFTVTCTGGGWNLTMDQTKLTGGAGTDFATPQPSASNLVDISIDGVPGNGRYICSISYSSAGWPGGVGIYARGTNDGAPVPGGGSQPSITWFSGLNVYQQVTTGVLEFFRGRRIRTGIKIQYQLTGLSVALGVNSWTATITYTLVDG